MRGPLFSIHVKHNILNTRRLCSWPVESESLERDGQLCSVENEIADLPVEGVCYSKSGLSGTDSNIQIRRAIDQAYSTCGRKVGSGKNGRHTIRVSNDLEKSVRLGSTQLFFSQSYLSIVVVDYATRNQVRSAWKVHNSRCVSRARAKTWCTAVAVSHGFLDSRSIIRDSIANCAVGLDIPEDGVVFRIGVEASNALVFDVFHPIGSTVCLGRFMLAKFYMRMGLDIRTSRNVGRFVRMATFVTGVQRKRAGRIQAQHKGCRGIKHCWKLKQQANE